MKVSGCMIDWHWTHWLTEKLSIANQAQSSLSMFIKSNIDDIKRLCAFFYYGLRLILAQVPLENLQYLGFAANHNLEMPQVHTQRKHAWPTYAPRIRAISSQVTSLTFANCYSGWYIFQILCPAVLMIGIFSKMQLLSANHANDFEYCTNRARVLDLTLFDCNRSIHSWSTLSLQFSYITTEDVGDSSSRNQVQRRSWSCGDGEWYKL